MRRLLVIGLSLALAASARAEDDPAVDWIRPESITEQADALLEQVEASRPELAQREAFDEIEHGLVELGPRLEAAAQKIDAALGAGAPLSELADLKRELEAVAAPIAQWEQTLAGEAPRVAELLDQLGRSEALWSKTLERHETAAAGEAVERRARAALDLARQSREQLLAWQRRVLALEDRVAERRTRVKKTLDRLAETQSAQARSLLIPEQAPIWRSSFIQALREELPRVPAALAAFNEQNRQYVFGEPRQLVAQAVVGVLLVLAIQQAGRRARRRAAAEPELAEATRVLERPFSIGVLLTLLATPWLHPLAPQRFRQLMLLLALLPVARIVTVASAATSRGVLAGLFALLVLDRLGLSLQTLPAVDRLSFLVTLAFALALALRVVRRGGLPGDPRWVRRAASVAAGAFSFALLAELGGWAGLSALLGRAALGAVLAGVYLWAAVMALDALLAFALRSPRFARFGLARTGELLAERRARRLVRWLAALLWLYVVLTGIGLLETTLDAVRALLAAGVSIGALSLTLGGVLAFVLTIVVAPIVARFIDLVLEQGVYPRARLPRGMPYALSTLVRYAVYTLAFLTALAAAGVQLSQLSILLGGLGVGLGLGLQDMVKNFAAGLTLLLERRVHVGDVVQIPSQQIFGRVLEIGMRASLVRNWDGAEVVVPNGDLVASAVTNWTLSDQLRRIEIPVGVAYGTDPERVVALLLEVGGAHADVIDEPPPQALFQGFGESSLDFLLRVWTDAVYDRTLAIRSELALGIHRALGEAGITIPFPQRDLHLASVSPEARALFAGSEKR
jgi:small-conductance mechanosensitive channel